MQIMQEYIFFAEVKKARLAILIYLIYVCSFNVPSQKKKSYIYIIIHNHIQSVVQFLYRYYNVCTFNLNQYTILSINGNAVDKILTLIYGNLSYCVSEHAFILRRENAVAMQGWFFRILYYLWHNFIHYQYTCIIEK